MRRLLLIMLVLMTIVAPASAGPYRNAYYTTTMPWHRTFHDVNLCTGNLMKSFTDIQVAPALGAGLVLQRTYNSNDDSEGGFGHGWSHAYEIQMQEASSIASPIPWTDSNGNPINPNCAAVRTDFFGGKHVYKREADGLYSPPPYLHDWMQSSYDGVLANGPGAVSSDTDTGIDGTVKHYRPIDSAGARVCDYIADRHGNTTNLAYDESGNLSTVTDPSGRVLQFTWTTYYDSQENPHPRITQVTGPLQTVAYSYYQSASDSGAGGEPFNLESVTVDPGGLSRTTTFTYTSYTDTAGTATGLLNSVTDPLGHTVSYQYQLNIFNECFNGPESLTNTVWVSGITEPGGVDSTANHNPRSMSWAIWADNNYAPVEGCVMDANTYSDGTIRLYVTVGLSSDNTVVTDGAGAYPESMGFCTTYDANDNPINVEHATYLPFASGGSGGAFRSDSYKYGRYGNVLYHWVEGFSNALRMTGHIIIMNILRAIRASAGARCGARISPRTIPRRIISRRRLPPMQTATSPPTTTARNPTRTPETEAASCTSGTPCITQAVSPARATIPASHTRTTNLAGRPARQTPTAL